MYITDIYAESCFSDEIIKKYVSKECYDKLKKTVDNGNPLDIETANEVKETASKVWDAITFWN